MEKYVEMLQRVNAKETEKVGEFVLKEGSSTVEYIGDPEELGKILDDGSLPDFSHKIGKGKQRGRVRMTDGEAFLVNLTLSHHGSMSWATKVKEREVKA